LSDKTKILHAYSVAGYAVESISSFQQATGYLLALVSWLTVAGLVVQIWRLFACYIACHIFDRQAVSTFRVMASLAVAVYVVDLVVRHVQFAIMTNGTFRLFFSPGDVMNGAIVLLLVVVAEVFSAGAAIAEEHSQIV
jgi:hypothetical protein